ncbi:MAG: hypothetical protein WCP86_06870, partial [bacterium]
MHTRQLHIAACLLSLCSALSIAAIAVPETRSSTELRAKAQKLNNDGNFKEALDIWQALAQDPKDEPAWVGNDLQAGVACLQALNRDNESDGFREKVIGTHSNNWLAAFSTAQSYFTSQHYGTIVAGKFERGPNRGGGRYVNSYERDRCRALQLMDQARTLGGAVISTPGTGRNITSSFAGFQIEFARMLMGYRGYQESWRLQYLTDFSKLPDYEEGYWHGDYGYASLPGAPVDTDGNPVFHKVPATWATSRNDGERWRWMLAQAVALDPERSNDVLSQYAEFLQQQFDVETISNYSSYLRGRDSDEDKPETGSMYLLHTLGEDETIARLATGIKRFKLPADADFIAIYRQLNNWYKLGNIFEHRRQYEKAAEAWKKAGQKDRVEQILGNWGQFEPLMTHPAGKEASVDFRFRNGTKVTFAAHEI